MAIICNVFLYLFLWVCYNKRIIFQKQLVIRKKEQNLQEQAQKDSLTGLYNHLTGKMLISEYLSQKTPFSSCGMMLLDIDYFKNINDNYRHLFLEMKSLQSSQNFFKVFSVPKMFWYVQAGMNL